MAIRTDPLTKGGKIDSHFFASEEYEQEQKSLLRYLKLEGFTEDQGTFVIQYRDRTWQISFNRSNT